MVGSAKPVLVLLIYEKAGEKERCLLFSFTKDDAPYEAIHPEQKRHDSPRCIPLPS